MGDGNAANLCRILDLADVARVLMEQVNFSVNSMLVIDASGARLPLFQWAVDFLVDTDMTAFEMMIERADICLLVDPFRFIYGL